MTTLKYDQDAMFRSLADIAPVLIWMCDSQGTTVYFNKAWLDFTGRSIDEELATHWIDRIHPADYEACNEVFNTAFETQQGFKAEYRLRCYDGAYYWVLDEVVPRFHQDASFAGFAGFCTNISAQKAAQEREEKERAFAETLANVALALTASIELDDVLDEIIGQTQNLFHHEATNIMLVEDHTLHTVRWHGYDKFGSADFISSLRQTVGAFPLDRIAIQSRKPIVVPDTHAHPMWIVLPQTEWIRSNVIAPIYYGDLILGMVRLSSSTPGFFKPKDAEHLIPLTNAVGVALMNAKLFQQVQHELTERQRAEEIARNLNARLEQRVEERTAELAAANTSLRELDRLKSKFVADVSHELRTPIAVLSLKLELLERKPEKFLNQLPEMQKHVDHLTSLINDILDISRFELGKDKVDFEVVQLNSLAERVVNAHRERAESAGLRLTFTPGSALPEIEGEPNQISQVVTNLLSNAIKYTPHGDIWVTTGYDKKKQSVFVAVRDSGMGIGTDDLPHLFDRFYRGKRAGSSTIPGTGLGLSIVKEIVDIHNGYIDVESEVGKGSIFKVWLPCPDA